MCKPFDLSGEIVIVTGSASGMGIGISGYRPHLLQLSKGGKANFHQMDVNGKTPIKALINVFPACKYAPYIQKNGGSAIVDIGSTAAAPGNHSQGASSFAKGGIEHLTPNIAYQYGKDHIHCK